MRELTPANQNPWYILMTLHGEPEGDGTDHERVTKNSKLWNTWSCQILSEEDRARAPVARKSVLADSVMTEALASEIRDRFAAEFLRRNPKARAAPEMPDPVDRVDLSNAILPRGISLSNFIFAQPVSFLHSRFEESAGFAGATFLKLASFSHANFKQVANFGRVVFAHDAVFLSVAFDGEAWFQEVEFRMEASFRDSIFKQLAYFRAANFKEIADFRSVTFAQDAEFKTSTFMHEVYFRSVTFDGLASFSDTKFLADVFLAKAKAKPKVDFSDCAMNGPVSLEGAEFWHHYPKLTNTTLHKLIQVTADDYHWPRLPKRLNIWTGRRQVGLLRDHTAARASAKKLRHAVAQQGLPDEEHFFFRREMHHAAREKPWWRTAHIYLFEEVSDFGYSIWRPSLLLGLLWAAGWWFYSVWTPLTVWQAAAYSFSSMFKFFGFQRTFMADHTELLTGWAAFPSALQTVLAFVLLFFLGLGLRTQFRLR